jgi:1,4-alpha-glucan branching enzyme
VRDLNALYRAIPALHQRDCEAEGFEWVVSDDSGQSVLAFLRKARDGSPPTLVVCNFMPTVRRGYRIGVPAAGTWRERLNSDAAGYGGSDQCNSGAIQTRAIPAHGQPVSLELTLPPLATTVLTL